jgi:hypothetical protein
VVLVFDSKCLVAAGPQRAKPLSAEVRLLCESAVEPLDAPGERRFVRPHDRVIVRCHEAELGNLPPVAQRRRCQPLDERVTLWIIRKQGLFWDRLTDDVVDPTRHQDSLWSCHESRLRGNLKQKCNRFVPEV